MAGHFVTGKASDAPFTLKIYRGEGMCLLAMDWRNGEPPRDFVGFSIEYREPGGDRFYPVMNRLCLPGRETPAAADGREARYPSTEAPIQKFRWVHFPRRADLEGEFTYRVAPLFMAPDGVLNRGVPQEATLDLWRETYRDKVNICFTRGFVSSQAFVDRYSEDGLSKLIPASAEHGLEFVPSHPKTDEALAWMGYEARERIVDLLKRAAADGADVRMIAFELNLPELVDLLEPVAGRLSIIVDDSGGADGKASVHSPESKAAARLLAKGASIKRQHMGRLQHNKVIIVDGPTLKAVVYGSTNFSWRGFYVQANNAVVVRGKAAVDQAIDMFDSYWNGQSGFRTSAAATWRKLPVAGVNATITMSPHSKQGAVLKSIADDIDQATSSLLYSLAFLYQTPGSVTEAIGRATQSDKIFVYGISDKETGILVQTPDGNRKPVYSSALTKFAPEPFKSEPSGGGGNKMHHKFVVIDFDKPTARVYTGSFNFSYGADEMNGENLILFKDQRIATAYMIEALRLFDHYHFRVAQKSAKSKGDRLNLKPAPKQANHHPWWRRYYTEPVKIKDREMFG